MKLSLLFVAILGVAAVSAVPTRGVPNRSVRSLSDDWADFFALINTDEILAVVINYLAEDEEVQQLVTYVLSEDFANVVLAVEAIPEYIAFLDYLDAAGLNVYYYVNIIHDILGLPGLTQSARSASRLASSRITGGIAGLWADLGACLPIDNLKALHHEKLATSEDYANLFGLLQSDDAKNVYNAMKANEEIQWIITTLKSKGLDVDAILDFIKATLGW